MEGLLSRGPTPSSLIVKLEWYLESTNRGLFISHFCFELIIFTRPRRSKGLLYKHLCYSSINSFTDPLVPRALWRRHTQTIRDRSSSYEIELSKSRRTSKSHQWFKNYSHFTGGVDFAYWWILSRGGSVPAQQAVLIVNI